MTKPSALWDNIKCRQEEKSHGLEYLQPVAKQNLLKAWKDPLARRIVLYRETWNVHILTNHPDMGLRLEDVGLTVEKPEVILRQGSDRLFYRQSSDSLGNIYLKVAVRFKEGEDAFVTSAYGVRMLEEKGEIEWREK